MEQAGSYRFSTPQVYILFGMLVFLLFFRLDAPPIYILDEARNAQAGREMFQKGDWIVPTFNGELRSHKPVLHYWFMQPAFWTFGENAFAARFFSAVMGVLTVQITFLYTKRLVNQSVAFCAALALTLSTHFLFEFRLAVPDPYLIFFSTLGTFAAFTYLQARKTMQLYIAAIAFGLATLAKGPVAIGLPGIALLIWVIWKRQWKMVLQWHILGAAITFVAVALPWYLAVHNATNGRWTQEFFFQHNFNRFSEEMEGHGGIFLITVAIVLVGMLPLTTFLGEVVRRRKMVFIAELIQFGALVTIVFTGFYSVSSTKLPNYPMPCYPFFAVVLGGFLHHLMGGSIQSKRYPQFILLFILLAIPVAGYFAIQQEVEAKHISWIALTLLIAPVMYAAYLLQNRQADWFRRIIFLGLSYTVFNLLFLHIVYPRLYDQNPVSKTIGLVRQHQYIHSYRIYNPGFNFYVDGIIKEYQSLDSIRVKLSEQPDALIISRKEFAGELDSIGLKVIAEHHDIFELPTTIILKKDAAKP